MILREKKENLCQNDLDHSELRSSSYPHNDYSRNNLQVDLGEIGYSSVTQFLMKIIKCSGEGGKLQSQTF